MRLEARWTAVNPRTRGVLLALIGAITIGVDPLATRFLTEAGSEFWAFFFWRTLVFATFGLAYAVRKAGSARNLLTGIRAVGKLFPVLALLMGSIEALMVFGLARTTTAKCLLLFSLNPLWAAALSFILLKERLRPVTAAALLMSLIAVGIVFLPPALGAGSPGTAPEAANKSSTDGDVCAALAGVCFSLYVVFARRAGQQSGGKADVTAAVAVGGYLASFFALGMSRGRLAPPAAVGFDTARRPEWSFWVAVLVDGVGVGICLVCLSLAPRLATGPEVGIVMLLQLLLSPLWVWLAFGTAPQPWTIAGGLLLLVTLMGHELAVHRLQASTESARSAQSTTSTDDVGHGPVLHTTGSSEIRCEQV